MLPLVTVILPPVLETVSVTVTVWVVPPDGVKLMYPVYVWPAVNPDGLTVTVTVAGVKIELVLAASQFPPEGVLTP